MKFKQILANHLQCEETEIQYADGCYWRKGTESPDPADDSWIFTRAEIKKLQKEKQ